MTLTTATVHHSPELLRNLYTAIVKPRLIEEKMLLLLRQGKISKWFAGIGQEAIAVGAASALEQDDFILPMHRNLGVFTTRGVPLEKLFAQFQGVEQGFTKGRDRSFHFAAPEYRIIGMISHLGAQLAVANGVALGDRLRKDKRVTLAFTGEGGTSEGDFHEALNVASVWKLPVIFVIENNGYGLSTPISEQYACERLSDKAAGYGIEGVTIDGNDILTVYETVRNAAEQMREKPEPILIECMTFRIRGHEEASGVKYVPAELIERWEKRDPVINFEDKLVSQGILTNNEVKEIKSEIKAEIDRAITSAFSLPAVVASSSVELDEVYPEHTQRHLHSVTGTQSQRRFIDAISDALKQAMQRYSNLIIMGQDIAEYGGVFKVTEGFVEEFGRERIRNTPICESAILGAALGLGVNGFKSIVEMQFADFVSCGFNQIVNNLAKAHYRWGGKADTVVRMPCGAGVGAGPYHSQSVEAWFCHVPGLKVVYPSFPSDAKGLLLSAIEDPAPVLFFEHKQLYRSIKEEILDDYYTVELGKARRVIEGNQLSIITYGAGVHWSLEVLRRNSDISADLIDLRTLVPLDLETIFSSIEKTGRALVLQEANLTGGFGGEVASIIGEHCFSVLDAPVMRCGSLDTPIPFAKPLEENYLASSQLEARLRELLNY